MSPRLTPISQTTYHSYGNDRERGSTDDLYTHYLFDFAGRTVNAYTTDATGINILGASTAVYTKDRGRFSVLTHGQKSGMLI